MQGFNGFPAKGRLIKIPGLFFSELLPQIDSLIELKVTLYCFWRFQLREEIETPYVRRREIEKDSVFMESLSIYPKKRGAFLIDGLERAVARGTLLRAYTIDKGHDEDYYFANTHKGRAAIEAIEKGEWVAQEYNNLLPINLTVERPNLYRLYEQNIGPLTPLIAEHLADLEKDYPLKWIEDAIQIAITGNIRKLNYIMAILKRWREQGRSASDDMSKNSEWYISGKYSDEIES